MEIYGKPKCEACLCEHIYPELALIHFRVYLMCAFDGYGLKALQATLEVLHSALESVFFFLRAIQEFNSLCRQLSENANVSWPVGHVTGNTIWLIK